MELRHLRYFIAVAEELHFQRAAERLHIEQSPLSRAIKDLEQHLGARLFERTTRSTRITWAGEVFLDQARNILASVEHARSSVRAAAQGYRGCLRIGLSDGVAQPRLASLLANSRDEDPDVEIRIFEQPLAQLLKGLRTDLLDVGFAMGGETGDGLIVEPIWKDPIAVVLSARHPLAVNRSIALADIAQEPLILFHPRVGAGCHDQINRVIQSVTARPTIADHVVTLSGMLTLVGADFGVGIAMASQAQSIQRSDVVVRSVAGAIPQLTTYLLRPDHNLSEPLVRFLDRARSLV